MAQLQPAMTVRIKLDLDTDEAQRKVRRGMRLLRDANVEIARVRDNIEKLRAELEEHGIGLEVEK